MSEVIAMGAAIVLNGLVILAVVRWYKQQHQQQRRRFRVESIPEPLIEQCSGYDDNGSETGHRYTPCGVEVPGNEAHQVVSVQPRTTLIDDDLAFRSRFDEGSALVAIYCKRHCPGNCDQQDQHVEAKEAI